MNKHMNKLFTKNKNKPTYKITNLKQGHFAGINRRLCERVPWTRSLCPWQVSVPSWIWRGSLQPEWATFIIIIFILITAHLGSIRCDIFAFLLRFFGASFLNLPLRVLSNVASELWWDHPTQRTIEPISAQIPSFLRWQRFRKRIDLFNSFWPFLRVFPPSPPFEDLRASYLHGGMNLQSFHPYFPLIIPLVFPSALPHKVMHYDEYLSRSSRNLKTFLSS